MKRGKWQRIISAILMFAMIFTIQNVGTLTVSAETVAEDKQDVLVYSEDEMEVVVNKEFPSVVQYNMTDGGIFYGQTSAINEIEINGSKIALSAEDVTYEKVSDAKAVYTMNVKNTNIDAVVTAEIVVSEGCVVAFNITEIKNNNEETLDNVSAIIQTIGIPNHSLVSVRSTQEGANFKGATMSMNTHISGDEYLEVTKTIPVKSLDYIYGFVSNEDYSAAMWSNSEHDGRAAAAGISAGSKNTRVHYTVQEVEDGERSLGLESSEWYYHRVITDTKGRSYIVDETEMPQTKIIITGDRNDDEMIDWQDGAIAYRDIQHELYKGDEVPELVAYRIAMNFGGQAQNPFLTTLDNVKKVALHTDGLGQSVLLKGYGSEGHDSGHPDYANIGERIGGAEDMNFLMEEGIKYGARFGIHINASEMYPEAQAFTDDSVRRNSAGALMYGWNWLDQGIGIDGLYDLGTGNREARLDALKELVGDNLDFIYLDVWGNNTSSNNEDSWLTRKVSKEIISNGWRMSNEWGGANEYDATFQHWAADLTYGGYSMKGENSEVMRFIHNHEKDSWVGDYPSYGGAANAPLLGGYNMKDFEGWQGRSDYDAYITNLYNHDVMTKFIQHFEVIKWVNGDPVTMSDNSQTYQWIPEMEITLKDDAGNVVVAARESNDISSADYRNRTVTLNGKVISTGAVSKGDGSAKGDETYLIPWLWDAQTGEFVSSADEKLYHWNVQGGTTTWELQDSWADLENVKVYKLTDLGKTEEQTVEVVDGTITLTAEAETPYVVYKGEADNLDITWSTGMHIVDAGFNSGALESWDVADEAAAAVVKSQSSNGMLKLSGENAVSQVLTDLEEGQRYAVYVGVDNRSDAKAWITLEADGKELDANYTEKSIALNYVKADPHSTSNPTVDGNSYFQNMYVYFTAPAGDVTLTLKREAGEGDTYFDNIRIVESEADPIVKNEDGKIVKFTQDFENNAQGIYPFVVGGIEGVEDNRTHLSELHAPYTQAGWDVKKLDDVIDGNWSLKVNGLCSSANLVYQTIPQNIRFETGVTYKISFDYQAGWTGSYGVAVGNGEYSSASTTVTPLEQTRQDNAAPDQDGHYEFTLTGAAGGQSWFGIASTGNYVDTTEIADKYGATGNALNFGGYLDIVIDNVVIERVDEEVTAEKLEEMIAEVQEAYQEDDYSEEDWAVLEEALVQAQVALNKDVVSEKEIENAYYELKGADMHMSALSTSPAANSRFDISVEGVHVTAGDHAVAGSGNDANFGGQGDPAFVIDGSDATCWITPWDRYGDMIASGDGWIDLEYPEPHTVDGLRYLPAQAAYGGQLCPTTSYQIYVKTADSDEYQLAAEGSWAEDSSWKIAAFDAVENVTNVKLLTLQAGTANWWPTAAEIRAISTAEADSTKVVDKTALATLIKSAEELDQADYTEELWNNVQEKLDAAKAVYDNTDATLYDVKLAEADLTDAVNKVHDGSETPEPVENPFEDISEADYFYDAVMWAVENNVTAGDTLNTFAPYKECNRAQIVLFLYRALGGSAAGIENPFTDVSEADYCYDAVLWAVEEGITTGITATTFEPWKACTRAEIVTFLWRAMGSEAVEAEITFPDVTEAEFFYDAVAWAVENGVTQGRNDGTFGAWNGCWRADAVTLIQRAVEK